ncbi:hypothetical protein BDCR2A_00024 [Borrelia duttonii CR2A]|uniref:Uncharacterized protein n=1 Tax=Borrelia duttonii CR2A TaxID=1432657 RepID=W6TY59_9SPIR|nr:hypothetical protein BDCR2A_00024 [Borrelia duttonii CR2A]
MVEHNTKQTNTKNLLIIYIDKKHLNKNTNAIIKKMV